MKVDFTRNAFTASGHPLVFWMSVFETRIGNLRRKRVGNSPGTAFDQAGLDRYASAIAWPGASRDMYVRVCTT